MNVHGFNDINQRRNNESQNDMSIRRRQNQHNMNMFDQMDPLTVQNLKNAQQHRVLFVSGNRRMKNPKEQNYFDMLKELCCPTFKCISFTSLVLLVTLIMFIVQLSLGLNRAGQFLQVKTSTLLQLGANYAPYIREGQVYRLIAPIFLHVNFLHFFGNMLAIFMFVTRIEYSFGIIRTLVIYLLSGIGGNIFSALIDEENVKAGASTSLYGVIGVIIGYLIINWKGLDLIGPILKYQLCCTSIMIIAFIFFFSVLGTANVDAFGHLGGFLTGLFLSSINQTIQFQKYQKITRSVFFGLFLVEFIICFVVFFTK